MPRPLRVPLDGLATGVRALPTPAARYVSRVHRLGPGDRLMLFDPTAGTEAEARIVQGVGSGVHCEIECVGPSGYRASPITLIHGLAKAAKPDEVIRDATALGVARIVLAQTERSVARPAAERLATRQDRWVRIAIEAARQSGRGNIPSIEGPCGLAGALGAADERHRIVLVPEAKPLLERVGAWGGEPLALLVGPEGGFTELELHLANEAGFLPASLGPTTLRTELASAAALGALVALSAARRVS